MAARGAVIDRRRFIAACAAAPLAACGTDAAPLPPGALGGSNETLGHRLREGGLPAPTETRRVAVAIVGAGIGGLSAAWRLQRGGVGDYIVVDAEPAAGGNSRHGENAVSRFPFGAHYLPLPPPEATAVRTLLADLGAIDGDPFVAAPRYDERLLCHAPQERVYCDGIWEEGLLPRLGMSRGERDEVDRFQSLMAEFRAARDPFGRRAFALPVAHASRDLRWLGLDRLTMAEWLRANGFAGARLHWYVNHACLDDFGTDYRAVSAWAGIHYFACRAGAAANAGTDAVLTAPEGNGWIVRRLAALAGARIMTSALVFRLAQDNRGVDADVWLPAENRSLRLRADQLIWAAPLFVLPKVAAALPAGIAALAAAGDYAPWLVANLTLREPPAPGAGAPLAWDNVLYGAAGLGYVVATHQEIRARPGPTVLTYYRAFPGDGRQAREMLLRTAQPAWAEDVLAELSRAHGRLRSLTERVDLFRHGHAMIRPLPGVIHDPARKRLAAGWGRVRFAHADLSGMSLFEEANYHGVQSAEAIMSRLSIRQPSLLS